MEKLVLSPADSILSHCAWKALASTPYKATQVGANTRKPQENGICFNSFTPDLPDKTCPWHRGCHRQEDMARFQASPSSYSRSGMGKKHSSKMLGVKDDDF